MRSHARSLFTFAALSLSATLIGCASSSPTASATTQTDHSTSHAAATPAPAQVAAAPAKIAPADDTTPIAGDSTVLLVNGLSCPKCATNIHVSLGSVPGVADSSIDLESGRVTVLFDRFAKVHPSPATLAKVVSDSGFTLVGIE